jgi:hypothetical protein
MTFSRKEIDSHVTYAKNNNALERVDVIKDIGIYLDSKLQFNVYFDKIVKQSLKLKSLKL